MAASKYLLPFICLMIALLSYQASCKTECTHDGRLVKCSTESIPVCAFFKKNKSSATLFQMQATNACTACSNDNVVFYEEGLCKGNKVYCDPKVRVQFCTREYAPVCAYSKDKTCNNTWTKTTAGNKCTACADYSTEFFIRGEC